MSLTVGTGPFGPRNKGTFNFDTRVLKEHTLYVAEITEAAKARAELDWRPSHPDLVDEFRNGSYRNGGADR